MAGITLAACDDRAEPVPTSVPETPAIDASAYSAVISAFLPPAVDGERPVVWIAQLAPDPISLDDQVGMIAEVETTHDLRFVDDPEAAVGGDEGATPRDDGMLLGIGEIRAEPPHTVRVEVFVDNDRVRAELVTLASVDGRWRIDGREIVDPEDLVVDE